MSEPEKFGIKETKELVECIGSLLHGAIDPVEIMDALKGSSQIPQELKDLSFSEFKELLATVIKKVSFDLFKSLKK